MQKRKTRFASNGEPILCQWEKNNNKKYNSKWSVNSRKYESKNMCIT